MIKAHSFLLEIENYTPGKAKIGDRKAIKLSSNENALGSSKLALEAYKNHHDQVFRYADGSCELLREALGEKYNIDKERIVCGAGSDELIAFLTSAFAGVGDEIIYSQYGFLMYPISAQRVGAKAIKVEESNLKTNVDNIIAAISDKTKIIFIANPNNPTGSYLNKTELQKLIDNTPKNILIVLDCAYEEFVVESDYPHGIDIVNKYEKSWQKIFTIKLSKML